MKKKILTRNKNYRDLNIFLSTKDKSQSKILFKSSQENQDIKNESSKENKTHKYFNIFLHIKKAKNNTNSDNPTKALLLNNNFYKNSNKSNTNLTTSRHVHSLHIIKDYNQYKSKKYNTGTKIFIKNMIKINKPKLLKLLNRDLINEELYENKIRLKTHYSPLPSTEQKIIDDYIHDKSTSSRFNSENKINKNISSRYESQNDKENNELNDLKKTFIKFPKINMNYPLQLPDSITNEKQEMKDKINIDYFKDEKLKKKLRDALYFKINAFEEDNGKYLEFIKSKENFTNYIADINIIPHLKNKFLYNKPIYEYGKKNTILFSKNAINKEDAKILNRYLINNLKKEEIEKEKMEERERKMKELSASNNYLRSLCLEYEDEDFPKMTSDEVAEINDFFDKNIKYEFVTFADVKLKKFIYHHSKVNKKDLEYNDTNQNFIINT